MKIRVDFLNSAAPRLLGALGGHSLKVFEKLERFDKRTNKQTSSRGDVLAVKSPRGVYFFD